MKKGLYIVSTPIGNVKDISYRALEVLKSSEYIACEDTRVTKKLFTLLGINLNKKYIVYEDHNEEEKTQKIVDLITFENQAICLVSDAGSPLISDPGYKLVKKCREQGIDVTVIPGCCAVICGLQLSGLPSNRFLFAGFIPNREKARYELFYEFLNINATLIFYETAPRLLKSLNALEKIFPDREIAVAREITKIHEECHNGKASDLITYFINHPPKGEIVLMVAPAKEKKQINQDVNSVLKEKLKIMPLKTAVSETVKICKANKNEVYRLALEIKNEIKS